MYSQQMIRDSWSSEKMYDENLSSLNTMNLRDFYAKFWIGQRGNVKNKTIYNEKSNFVAIFYPSKNSYPDSDNYYKYCMYNLVKFKPWIGEKESVYGSINNSNKNIINLWYEYVEGLVLNGERMPMYLQLKLDTYLQNK